MIMFVHIFNSYIFFILQAECSFVSLRDVERSLEVLTWFENQPYLNTLLDNKFNELNKQQAEVRHICGKKGVHLK